jgi:hypothetical protein
MTIMVMLHLPDIAQRLSQLGASGVTYAAAAVQSTYLQALR